MDDIVFIDRFRENPKKEELHEKQENIYGRGAALSVDAF